MPALPPTRSLFPTPGATSTALVLFEVAMKSNFFSLILFVVISISSSSPLLINGPSDESVQPGPHWAIYWDAWVDGQNGLPDLSRVRGYNVLLLSFLLLSGAADQALAWTLLDNTTRTASKSVFSNAGIKLMVSAFGSTDVPVSAGADAVTTANSMAAWVQQWSLDGIDVDFEDFGAIDAADGVAEQWLIDFTHTLRAALPAGNYIITHAPVAPWFSPIYKAGAYLKVHQEAGNAIDWYNVQFYNQGDTEYTTCSGLFIASSSAWPQTAVFQIASSGVSLSKIVIGKIGIPSDAANGYMDPATLSRCLALARIRGFNGGVMVWEYPDAMSSWIITARGTTWPVFGAGHKLRHPRIQSLLLLHFVCAIVLIGS